LADRVETGDVSPPSELGEDASVEIHRPKPIHSWRELFKEVGVIAIGILIALGGEQTVEWLHRRGEVAEARKALRSEIAENARFARTSVEQERCLSARWDLYAAWANGGPRPPPSSGRPLFPLRTGVWEVVRSGAAAHMPLEERLAYAGFYDMVEANRRNNEQEGSVLLRLAGEHAIVTLTPAEARRVLEDVAQARVWGTVHSSNGLLMVETAKAMDIDPAPMSARSRETLVAICSAVGIAPSLPTPQKN
jgi:hypothetical protein